MARTGTRRIAGLALALGALGLALGGCVQVPRGGPLTTAINDEAKDVAAPFLLVPVTRMTFADLDKVAPDDFHPLASQQPAPDSVIHVGDMISVTLWEIGNGLLGPVSGGSQGGLAGAQSATVPNQTVDQTGTIVVPFAGEIRAAGRTTGQVQAAVVAALRGKATDAQVLVQIVQTNENAVTVAGDVNHPGRFPLATSGTRLLDAISTAGGTTGRARDMLVELGRAGPTLAA
jgi:polysaccharide export outer membrane protein